MIMKAIGLKSLLPDSNIKYASKEEYIKRIKTTIRLHQYTEPNANLINLFETLYDLEFEEYDEIRNNFKIDYFMVKKYAGILNEVIINDNNPLERLNAVLEMVKGRKSIACRGFEHIASIDGTEKEYLECANRIAEGSVEEIEIIRETFKEKYSEYANDSILADFYNTQANTIEEELLFFVREKLKRYYKNEAKFKDSESNSYVTHVILKNIRHKRPLS